MNKTVDSSDPKVHSQNIQEMLDELITRSRRDIDDIKEPRFLTGLKTAYQDYNEGKEKAWKVKPTGLA
jgi:hypothetical protein